MEHKVKHWNEANSTVITVDGAPDKCPFCHTGMKPTFIAAYNTHTNGLYVILMNCPMDYCQESFVAYYEPAAKQQHPSHAITKPTYNGRTSVGKLMGRIFEDEIVSVSEGFVKIYNEAFMAEQQGLLEICGVGYRKALEFLIKDYLISKEQDPEIQEKIKGKLLAACINEHVKDSNVKNTATRAVWLGNDETHYVRKWGEKSLKDLKQLIDLTIYWILAEISTQNFSD